ncbi:TolC family protein [Tautonia rosea]|uniref:TolC family protein n=1 Tax=Tautonia rosea TaxID=2728037 RepID=UPI001474665B|nr:TolC family protein [Tautonia rosea]
MRRRWSAGMGTALLASGFGWGCALPGTTPDYAEVARNLHNAAIRPPHAIGPDDPMAIALDPNPAPPELAGPRPVDDYIARALAENRAVQAAYFNVKALGHRIPQVTSLEDPVVSNTVYPSGSNGLQTATGFVPWNVLVAQQFPWFGTLALRGEAAEKDVQVAIAELATAQLDVVEAVKRAYADLYANEQSARILEQNRELVEDFIAIARIQYESGQTSQQDVLSAEVALADLDREFVGIRQGIESARADLAELMHITPEAPLQTTLVPPAGDVPGQIDRLYRLAVASRPELKGRLAAVARDAVAVELAKKRSAPNVTLGFNYGLVSEEDSVSPVANGNDNIGLFVGFNLPIYRRKIDGAILEAQARAVADAKLYDAERDGIYRELKDLLSRAQAQRETLDLFQESILPRARDALDIAVTDYQAGRVDFLTLISAWREVLQIELQVARFEAELGKSLASLERAVGIQLRDHPLDQASMDVSDARPTDEVPPPPPPIGGPFSEEEAEGGS